MDLAQISDNLCFTDHEVAKGNNADRNESVPGLQEYLQVPN